MGVWRDLTDPAMREVAVEILAKCGIGLVLAGLIGLERELERHPAGVRTHMLLMLGVILLGEASKHFGSPDNSRIAAQIITGIGFLGAGAIWRLGTDIRGMTTAASIWATSAIGLGISAGGPMLLVSIVAALAVLVTLTVIERLELALKIKSETREMLVTLDTREVIPALLEMLEQHRVHVNGFHIVGRDNGLQVAIKVASDPPNILDIVRHVEGVRAAEWV